MDNNNEQLKKLARIFNADKLVTPEDIVEVLKGIKNIMETFKKDNISLTEEAKSTVSELFDKVQSSHEEMLSRAENLVEEARGNVSKETQKALAEINKTSKELKKVMKEVELMKPLDGKDADEEKIVEEVLSKIKLPEYKETVLDGGKEIVEKINESDVKIKGDKVDLTDIEKFIKNVETMARQNAVPITTSFINGKRVKNINFTGAQITYSGDTATVTITAGTADNITGLIAEGSNISIAGSGTLADPYVISSSGGGGHTIQDEGTPLTQRTNLNFVGAGVAVTDDSGNDATVVTINGGGGDVTKVGTPVNNQVGVWTGDGTLEGDVDLTFDTATNTLGVGLTGLDGIVQVHSVKSDASAGLLIESANGTDVSLLGVGNTANATHYGVHQFPTGGVQIGSSVPFADAAGTLTLQNVDALDATTEATIESAIDTLANLTSIQGRTVTLADAGANAIFGWDDTAGAYENLTQAEARTVLGLGTAAYVATDLADLNEATIESAIDTLANLTSIQGLNVTLADAGADAILGWDDSAGAYENLTQAEVLAVIGDSSDTAKGVVELTTTSEVNTGTDTARAVTADALAGSYAGTKNENIYVLDALYLLTTGDGKAYFRVPSAYNGMNLVACAASVATTSSSGNPTIQVARGRQANATTAHAFSDMLSTRITIDSTEYDSKDATTAAVIDTSTDDVLTGDLIRIDVDVTGTGTKGLWVSLEFRLP